MRLFSLLVFSALAGAMPGGLPGATPGAVVPGQRLDPLVITGTRTAQRLSETPIRTEVLGNAELRF
jgi:outer membrane receptor protein involved in Fe transport